MKTLHVPFLALTAVVALSACRSEPKRLYMDVHHVPGGKVTLAEVAGAHQKDLAAQEAHDVRCRRYWVDEGSGTIFCLAEAPSAAALTAVHREAHGLLADEVHEVVAGARPAKASGVRPLFMDTHAVEAGVRADDVATAHEKDLAVQAKHDVRCLEYWVDERGGYVYCLVEAPDADAVVDTHREAHGLLPRTVQRVVEGT